jgi:hypothetical protein
MISEFLFRCPILFKPSNAIPALIAPSPIILTTSKSFFNKSLAAVMPRLAEIDVELCAAPNGS